MIVSSADWEWPLLQPIAKYVISLGRRKVPARTFAQDVLNNFCDFVTFRDTDGE